MFRYLLLFAWSNSSISPITYCLLLPKCNSNCSLCYRKDRSSTYDSLTSYYNRIGDRFHDIGKWDQREKKEKQALKFETNSHERNESKIEINPSDYEFEVPNKIKPRKINKIDSFEDHYKLNESSNIYSSFSDQYHSKANSLIVKEISNNQDDTSSLSSLTTVTNKPHYLSNGLLVMSTKHVHL